MSYDAACIVSWSNVAVPLHSPTQAWLPVLQQVRSNHGLVAVCGGLIVRSAATDAPIVVSLRAAGPQRLCERAAGLEGAGLAEMGIHRRGWRLNALDEMPVDESPLRASAAVLRSSRVRSVSTLTCARRGLFTGWFALFLRRSTPDIDPDGTLVQQLSALTMGAYDHAPVQHTAVLVIDPCHTSATCEHGTAWLAVPQFDASLRAAAKRFTTGRGGPNTWLSGALICFTGVASQCVASITPCRRADVLTIARLTHPERRLLQQISAGLTPEQIAQDTREPVRTVRDAIRQLELHRLPGGVEMLLRLVEQGWQTPQAI